MSNPINFSQATNPVTANSEKKSQIALSVHPFEVMALNEKTSLLVSKHTGKSFPVAVQLIGILQGINTFRTIHDHHERLPAHVKQTFSLQALTDLLEALVRSGVASKSDDVVRSYHQKVVPTPAEPASSRVFILTCDRERELERLLASIFSNAELSVHESIYLLDDSRDTATAARNRAELEKYQDNSPIPLKYFGQEEKKGYIQRLIDVDPNSETAVRYLLDQSLWQGQKTYGLSRNWALILSADYRCVMLDDDVLCEAFYPAVPDERVKFSNSISVQVFASETDWRSKAVPTEFDPLRGHLQLLGRDVEECLKEYNCHPLREDQLEGMNASQLTSLSPQSPILISECGSFGDPGFPSHAFLLKSPPQAVEDVLLGDPDLSLSFGQRQFQAVQQTSSIYDSAGISQITGLDNSRLLPPYFPAFRGEDGLFGWLVKMMYPESRTIIYNWGVPHQPIESRASSYLEEAIFPKINLGGFKGLTSDRGNLVGESTPKGKLNLIAAMIRELSERSESELIALAGIEAARRPASAYFDASSRLPYFSETASEYTAYLQYAIKKASDILQSPPTLAFWFDMPSECYDVEVVSRIASKANGFADALDYWPEIWQAAAEMNS